VGVERSEGERERRRRNRVLILSRRLGGGVHRRGGSGDGESSTELFVDRRRKTTGEGVGPQLGLGARRDRPETAQAEERERKKILLYFFPGTFKITLVFADLRFQQVQKVVKYFSGLFNI
jgi:hypothetical protein